MEATEDAVGLDLDMAELLTDDGSDEAPEWWSEEEIEEFESGMEYLISEGVVRLEESEDGERRFYSE